MAQKSSTTSTSNSASERARRLANRSGSAPAPDAPAEAMPPSLPPLAETAQASARDVASQPAVPSEGKTITSPATSATQVQTATPAPTETNAPTFATVAATLPVAATNTDASTPPGTAKPAPIPSTPASETAASAPATVIDVDRIPTPPPAPEGAIDVDRLPSVRPTTPAPHQDHFPPLPDAGIDTMSHAEKRKGKGKNKAKAADAPPPAAETTTEAPTRPHYDADAADLARGITASLGYPTDFDGGASSSRCPAAAPESPSKRQRANTAGQTVPVAQIPAPATPHANYGTIDGLPPRGSFTPSPPEGFRSVMGMTSATLFRNHPPTQRCQWDDQRHPKLLAFISGGNGDRIQMAQRIQRQLADRFNMNPTAPLVGPPGLAEGPGPDPIAWLIGGLPIEQAQILLDEGALVSDGLATFFLPYHTPLTGFLATFDGLTIPEHDTELAQAVIAGAITDDPAIARHVRAHRDAFPANVSADEAFARFAESIYVVSIPLLSPRGPFIGWNVYVNSPTENETEFATLRSLINNLVITTPFNGQGRVYRPLLCHICRAIDHPTNLCPFPHIPGWMGPTPETTGTLEQASREALTGRPNKFTRAGSQARDNGKNNGNSKGKGKDRDGRQGGNGHRK